MYSSIIIFVTCRQICTWTLLLFHVHHIYLTPSSPALSPQGKILREHWLGSVWFTSPSVSVCPAYTDTSAFPRWACAEDISSFMWDSCHMSVFPLAHCVLLLSSYYCSLVSATLLSLQETLMKSVLMCQNSRGHVSKTCDHYFIFSSCHVGPQRSTLKH